MFAMVTCNLLAQTAPIIGGIPSDWSNRHVVYSGAPDLNMLLLSTREPRILHNYLLKERNQQRASGQGKHGGASSTVHIDWNMPLNGRLTDSMFAAKYATSMSVSTASCSDWIVFATDATSGNNLTGYTNLYVSGTGGAGTGLCETGTGINPTVKFDCSVRSLTNGRFLTSPVISLDGTKIAVVETSATTNSAVVHVVNVPAGPNATTCTETVTTLANTGQDTLSSPYVDYSTDAGYFGTDNGYLHKISGLFLGTPTETVVGWPALVAAGQRLTSPVLNNTGSVNSTLAYVAAGNGNFYSVNASTGAVTTSTATGKVAANSVLDGGIINVANGVIYWFGSNVGATPSNGVTGATLVATDTTANMALKSATAQQPLWTGATVPTALAVHSGTLTAAGTGIVACGYTVYSPGKITGSLLYYPLTAGVPGAPTTSAFINNAQNNLCSPVTEFKGSDNVDRFFVGTSAGGSGLVGCAQGSNRSTGCMTVLSFNGTLFSWVQGVAETNGTSGIVVDNSVNTTGTQQTSSIYLGTSGFTAAASSSSVKLTQSGLQ
jgi:hypothetical protein